MPGNLNQIFPSTLGTTQYISIFDPANTGNKWTATLNPQVIKRSPSTLRKYNLTVNQTSVITGSPEAPPKELSISYQMIDKTQIDLLIPFVNIAPVVIVLNDDSAYLGVLCVDELEQLNGYTRNVWSIKLSFLVLAPYDGFSTTLNKLTAPTITATLSAKPGYIANPSDIFLWMSVFTPSGESVVGSVTHIANSTTSAAYDLSWTPPTSLSYTKARIYWYSSNTVASSTLLCEVLSGFPQDIPNSFTVFNNYVEYSQIHPASFSTAFSGYWAAGLWQQTT